MSGLERASRSAVGRTITLAQLFEEEVAYRFVIGDLALRFDPQCFTATQTLKTQAIKQQKRERAHFEAHTHMHNIRYIVLLNGQQFLEFFNFLNFHFWL